MRGKHVQVAIVDGVINHMPCYTTVREVVIAELRGKHVQHAPGMRLLLSSIAPAAAVTELPVERQERGAASNAPAAAGTELPVERRERGAAGNVPADTALPDARRGCGAERTTLVEPPPR